MWVGSIKSIRNLFIIIIIYLFIIRRYKKNYETCINNAK